MAKMGAEMSNCYKVQKLKSSKKVNDCVNRGKEIFSKFSPREDVVESIKNLSLITGSGVNRWGNAVWGPPDARIGVEMSSRIM